ncbi:MAG: type II toxin-antitoxin system PemK/MazF family toxin [Isosphaeraceae bacterium]|jgi:mRNA-degrading endonuclease toxin of MazEF toxin-antitoxin module
MINPGEIYLAHTDAGVRPAVVVSREELNRGNWVVAVLITSAKFSLRSTLPHCVPFRAGEFGLDMDCTAQAETISYIAVADLDLDQGILGILDEERTRALIKAIGHVIASDCEPS